MTILRYCGRLMAIAATLLLVSCIDGREEIWLNADGSGRAEITYTLPAIAAKFQGGEAGVRKMLGEFLSKASGITSYEHDVSTLDDRLKVHVKASFASARDLKRIARKDPMKKLPPSAGNLAGDLNVAIHGRTVDFQRTISPGKALPGSYFMPASQFEGRRLVYVIHLPHPAQDTNAMKVEDGGRTLTWDFPLASAIKQPVSTRFTVKVPIPPWLIVSASGLLAVMLAGVAIIIRKIIKRKKRKNLLLEN